MQIHEFDFLLRLWGFCGLWNCTSTIGVAKSE